MIKFEIPIQPITKKNSQQILINRRTGKPFIMPSKKYREYEAEASYFMPKIKTINYPVNVKCIFYMKNKRKCDLTNLLEAVDDILVTFGVVSDDNYTVIQSHDGSRVFVDEQNPRTEVIIERGIE